MNEKCIGEVDDIDDIAKNVKIAMQSKNDMINLTKLTK